MKREEIIEQLNWIYDAISEEKNPSEMLPELRHPKADEALLQAIDILETTNDRTAMEFAEWISEKNIMYQPKHNGCWIERDSLIYSKFAENTDKLFKKFKKSRADL